MASPRADANATRAATCAMRCGRSETRHHAAIIEPKRVGELLRAMADHRGQPVTRAVLQLATLFQSPGEIRKAEWAEFDLDAGLWSIASARIDMATGAEGDVASYPSPEELWKLIFAEPNAWHDRFAAVPFEDKGGSWVLRYYQEIAVRRVLEQVAAGRDRILLTLATGTGKTSIAFQIAWKLFKSRWTLAGDGARQPRVLFLADRNILAGQAFNDFNAVPSFVERAVVVPRQSSGSGR